MWGSKGVVHVYSLLFGHGRPPVAPDLTRIKLRSIHQRRVYGKGIKLAASFCRLTNCTRGSEWEKEVRPTANVASNWAAVRGLPPPCRRSRCQRPTCIPPDKHMVVISPPTPPSPTTTWQPSRSPRTIYPSSRMRRYQPE